MDIVYFSTTSENTTRFVQSLGLEVPTYRIPLHKKDDPLLVSEPFVLIIPSYGGHQGERAVLPQIVRFLNVEQNRHLLSGVICCGNTNFGNSYCRAGYEIAAKCQVPLLKKVELFGTPEEVESTRRLIEQL